MHGMAVTFPDQNKMIGAWALLKRQYGYLQCLASVGLIFRVYVACVPQGSHRGHTLHTPSAAYACEFWGCQCLPQRYGVLGLELGTSHLQMLKEVTGVRGSTLTDINLAELGLKSLQHGWLYALPSSGASWLASLLASYTS